jgi:hypothetical protein
MFVCETCLERIGNWPGTVTGMHTCENCGTPDQWGRLVRHLPSRTQLKLKRAAAERQLASTDVAA